MENRDFSTLDVVVDVVDVSVPVMPAGEMHGPDEFDAHLRRLRTGVPEWDVSLDASASVDPAGETVRYSRYFDGSFDHQSSSLGMSYTCSERKGYTVV